MAFETRSGMPYIPYYEDPNFQLSYPPAAYRKGLADFAQMKADDADRMQKAMQSNLPSSLDYFDDDPTRIIQNQFQQYRDREPIPEPTRPVAVRPPSPAVQSRQMAAPPQQAQGPAPQSVQPITPPQLPATARANTAVQMPARPQTSAVQAQSAPAQGLLDTEETAEGGSFFDNPMSMGLIQAGLGLLSAPRYSTNPNDVTLSSALARGLGGFIQGYGGTRQRLTEEERQRLDDEFKRKQIESTLTYQKLLGAEAAGRTKQIEELLSRPAKNQTEFEARVREIFPDPENKTGQALIAAGYEEGSKMLAKYAGGMTETQRTGLMTKIKQDPILPENSKTMLLEMVNERDFEGKLANSTTQINNAINQIKDDLKPPKELKGDATERAENILINAEPGDSGLRISNAFNRLFMNPLSETSTFNPETQRVEIQRVYAAIPLDIQKKFPELTAQRRQLEQNQSTKPPTLSQRQEENRAAELQKFHDEINENNYDEPEGMLSVQSLAEGISPRFASDEYLLKIRAQDRWIENVLRAASGAAIAQSEYADKRAQYFPEPGEGEPAKKAKSEARDVVLQRAFLNLANQAEQERKQEAIPKTEVEDPDAALLEN